MESTICSKQINAFLLENFWEEYLFISQTVFDLHFQGMGLLRLILWWLGQKAG